MADAAGAAAALVRHMAVAGVVAAVCAMATAWCASASMACAICAICGVGCTGAWPSAMASPGRPRISSSMTRARERTRRMG
ncbi:MAG: hypothetical protein U1E75_07000 [Alicycliphilus sp.]